MKGGNSARRTETLAMRISTQEHKLLRAVASVHGSGEAELVRVAVNEWCEREGHGAVFREKGKAE